MRTWRRRVDGGSGAVAVKQDRMGAVMAEQRDSATLDPKVVRVLAELYRRLGLTEFTVDGLHRASLRLLGAERTARCVEVIGEHHLSRRYFQVANWASLVVAHTPPSAGHENEYPDDRVLPLRWWTAPGVYPQYYEMGREPRVPPDDVLWGRRFDHWYEPSEWRTVLDVLAARAQGETMPPAHDFIDLNRGTSSMVDPVRTNGVPLAFGDVIRLTFDPGYWVDATVTEVSVREGSATPVVWARCVEGSHRSTFCAAADWALGLMLREELVLLPGEEIGSSTDPYARVLVLTRPVREFLTLAAARDAEVGVLLTEGATFGDVHRLEATRRPARNGAELAISRGLAAVLDERPDLLDREMHLLRDSSAGR